MPTRALPAGQPPPVRWVRPHPESRPRPAAQPPRPTSGWWTAVTVTILATTRLAASAAADQAAAAEPPSTASSLPLPSPLQRSPSRRQGRTERWRSPPRALHTQSAHNQLAQSRSRLRSPLRVVAQPVGAMARLEGVAALMPLHPSGPRLLHIHTHTCPSKQRSRHYTHPDRGFLYVQRSVRLRRVWHGSHPASGCFLARLLACSWICEPGAPVACL